jgi:hypothetical protein
MARAKTLKKLPLWTLEQGIDMVRNLQVKSREFNYHVCIGGGVVNKGESSKDLDLYFLPLDNGDAPDRLGLEIWLSDMWGDGEPISDPSYENMSPTYKSKMFYLLDGNRRIDTFVVRG